MEKKALVVGGSNGLGLTIVLSLSTLCEKVYIIDKVGPDMSLPENVEFIQHNLLDEDLSVLNKCQDINTLVITAGFGRIAPFESILKEEIFNSFKVNTIAIAQILNFFYPKMLEKKDFYCAVMGSIAGLISSPLFAVYGATKAGVCKLIESLNIEIENADSKNRILNVSPGSIKGTKFNGGAHNDLSLTKELADEIIRRMFQHETLYIPDYEEIFKRVLDNYHTDPHEFGMNSYKYKKDGGRMSFRPQLRSGIIAENIDILDPKTIRNLKKSKEYCDYLTVVIKEKKFNSDKISFDDYIELLKGIRFINTVLISESTPSEIYEEIQYNYFFSFSTDDVYDYNFMDEHHVSVVSL